MVGYKDLNSCIHVRIVEDIFKKIMIKVIYDNI